MKLKLVLPKGKMLLGVLEILKETGLEVSQNGINLRPKTNDPELEVKILKPQNIGKLIELGRHDIGITGYDWLIETSAKTIELLDLKIYNGMVIAAIPEKSNNTIKSFFGKTVTVASEFEKIAKGYLDSEGFNYQFIRSYGATEAFPPEDADMIIDNTFSGKTLKENNLKTISVLLNTSARLISNKTSLENSWRREKIEKIANSLRRAVK